MTGTTPRAAIPGMRSNAAITTCAAWPAMAFTSRRAASNITVRRGRIGFAPRLTPQKFKAAFTSAEGWGTYRQERAVDSQSHQLEIRHGRLGVRTLCFELAPDVVVNEVVARLAKKTLRARSRQIGRRVKISLANF